MKNLKTLLLTLTLVLTSMFSFGQTDTITQFSTEVIVDWDSPYTQTFNTFQTYHTNKVLVHLKFSKMANVSTGTFTVYKNGTEFLKFSPLGNNLNNLLTFDTTMVVYSSEVFKFTVDQNNNGNLVRVNIEVFELLDENGFPLSSSENLEVVEMNMYPNPTSENLNFTFNNYPNQVTYNVYSMSGQLVKQGELVNTLYVGDLTNGMYVINLNVDGTTTSKKFLKQ